MKTYHYLPFEFSPEFNLLQINSDEFILGPHWPLIKDKEIELDSLKKCSGPLRLHFIFENTKDRSDSSTGGDLRIELHCKTCELKIKSRGFHWYYKNKDLKKNFEIEFNVFTMLSAAGKKFYNFGSINEIPYKKGSLFGFETRIYVKTINTEIMLVAIPNEHIQKFAWSYVGNLLGKLHDIDRDSKFDKKKALGH